MTGARALALGLLVTACAAPAFRPIAYGDEACAHCHMTITDGRFGAELASRKGRTWTFDDPTCLAAFLAEGGIPADQVAARWVNDFLHPERHLDAEQATYLRTDRIATPMGGGVIALTPGAEADSLRRVLGGEVLTWGDLMARPVHR